VTRTLQRLCAVLFSGAVLFAVAGCGGSDGESDGDDADTTTVETADDPSDDPSDTAADDSASADEGDTADAPDLADCDADNAAALEQELLSGSVTVMWADDAKSEHSVDELGPGATFAFQNDGSLEPSELTVGVGQVFAFTGSPDGVLRVAQIGCAGGQWIVGTSPAGFYITEPGTYSIFEETANDFEGAVVGSVTVR